MLEVNRKFAILVIRCTKKHDIKIETEITDNSNPQEIYKDFLNWWRNEKTQMFTLELKNNSCVDIVRKFIYSICVYPEERYIGMSFSEYQKLQKSKMTNLEVL